MEMSAILAAAYEDVGYPASPPTSDVTRMKRYLNEGLQAILTEPGLIGLLEADVPYTCTSVAGQARYSVPHAHVIVRHVRDTTNERYLESLSLADYRRLAPAPTQQTGTPTHWVPTGQVPVAMQPSNASSLFVDSTSASDTNTLYLEGVITGGYKRATSVTMTGTTAVNVAASITSWIEVTDWYLSAAAVGTVTLHEDAEAGTELGRITIGQKRPSYLGFYLWPTPAAAVTYTLDTRRDLDTLVQDTDEPPLPRDFHPMLAKYVAFREWERKDDDRHLLARKQYELWLSRLKYRMQTAGDSLLVARSTPASGQPTATGTVAPPYWRLDGAVLA